jgi:Ni,Fe-hydrogenase I large subunit
MAKFFSTILLFSIAAAAYAASKGQPADPIAPVILGVTGILFFAVLGRFGARTLGQPSVLGELLMGVILGNLGYLFAVDFLLVLREGPAIFDMVDLTLSGAPLEQAADEALGHKNALIILSILQGPGGAELTQVAHAVDVFSRYGVIFLLFLVGLETSIKEMREVGVESLRVAVLGVVLPFAFGFMAARLLMPELSVNVDLFVAATLGATSIGITARVLKDLSKARSHEAHVILGAAVIDDVLGLIMLAIVSGIIISGGFDPFNAIKTVTLASVFLLTAFIAGPRFLRVTINVVDRLDIVEAKMFISFLFVMALAWQREVVQIHTIFGGKNPHPNFMVGGSPSPISNDPTSATGGAAATAVNIVSLNRVRSIIQNMMQFVDQVYLPDTIAIASFYKDWFARGEGLGNFLTYGDFPATGLDDPSTWLIPGGAILNRDLTTIHPVDLNDPKHVQEFVSHSWYDYSDGKDSGLHPYDGETTLNYSGPKPPYDHLNVEESYSWLKAPRWRGHAMETGPLARVLMLYASGHEPTRELAGSVLKQLDLPLEAMFSTMGRTAARTLETKIIGDQMMGWLDNLMANIKVGDLNVHNEEKWDPSTWPREARGVGFTEAPRGALAHWVVIKDGKIDNYQAVVPTTWNAGPRDAKGQPGAYEAALMDRHKLLIPKQPLEIQRTLHSFDPCIACSVHVMDPEGEELMKIKVS